MVRAAIVVGETIDRNTGSSLYSRIGSIHIATPCSRMSAGTYEHPVHGALPQERHALVAGGLLDL